MSGSKLVDTSVWLHYFYQTSVKAKEIIDSDDSLRASVLTLYEIKKKLIRDGKSEKGELALLFIKRRATILPVSIALAEQAAVIGARHNLSMADAIIYASADGLLVTADKDFAGLKGVELLKA